MSDKTKFPERIDRERLRLDVHLGIRQIVDKAYPQRILTDMARAIHRVSVALYRAYINAPMGADDDAMRARQEHRVRTRHIRDRFGVFEAYFDTLNDDLYEQLNFKEWWVDHNIMHPCVLRAFDLGYVPFSYEGLLFEMPKVSDDGVRLAYMRDERNVSADLWTVTTPGKYLRRHFDISDHVIRDIVALWTASCTDDIKFLPLDVNDYIHAVLHGPHSCMRWSKDTNYKKHPYRCYAPELGWRMAVRTKGNNIVGRALVYDHPEEGSLVVRAFKSATDNPDDGGYSHADERLLAWLASQGVKKYDAYPIGTELALVENSAGAYLAPYLDGCNQRASIDQKRKVIIIDDCGEYELNETDGLLENRDCQCEACDDYFDEDDVTSIEFGSVDNYITVCHRCLENDYTYVRGRRGSWYYVYNDDAVYVDGDAYDSGYLSDNDIIELDRGNYSGDIVHLNDTVTDVDGNYWHENDIGDEVVMLTAGSSEGEYAPVDDCTITSNGDVWLTSEYEDEHEDEETTQENSNE